MVIFFLFLNYSVFKSLEVEVSWIAGNVHSRCTKKINLNNFFIDEKELKIALESMNFIIQMNFLV